MNKKNIFLFGLLIMLLTMLFVIEDIKQAEAFVYKTMEFYIPIAEPVVDSQCQEDIPILSDEDATLVALITMAEAEGESEEGQRLVIDVVFNRSEHPDFPDAIYDVVYQPRQFSPVWNGRLERCFVNEDILRLVHEEFVNRSNNDVIFFNANKYSKYGTPLFQVGNHYFSSYN